MSMIRQLVWVAAGLVVMMAFAPSATAEYYEGKPECPPEQVCTMSESTGGEGGNASEPIPYGPDDCIECSGPVDGNGSHPRGPTDDCVDWCPRDGEGDGPSAPQDCGGEVCAYDQPVDDGATCMDGAQAGEVCRDDVQYLDGREPGPIESAGQDTKAVPSLGVLGLVAGLGAVVLVARRFR